MAQTPPLNNTISIKYQIRNFLVTGTTLKSRVSGDTPNASCRTGNDVSASAAADKRDKKLEFH